MTGLGRALLDSLDEEDLAELAERLAPLLPRLAITDDRWLTSREAAEHLGLSLNALHKRTRRHEIPAVQESDGGKLYFRRTDLDRWRLDHANGA
jgi:excisionase family DNA binding protein